MAIITYKSELDINGLLIKAQNLKYWIDGSKAEMSITQSGGLPEPFKTDFAEAIREIENYRIKRAMHIMINKLAPGVDVPLHTDTVRGNENGQLERWHLPLITNNRCIWWDEDHGSIFMPTGVWHGPMPFSLYHKVSNTGDTERIHLIVDLI